MYLKKPPVLCNNESHYDYDFIINESAEEFKKQFISSGENTEK